MEDRVEALNIGLGSKHSTLLFSYYITLNNVCATISGLMRLDNSRLLYDMRIKSSSEVVINN